MITHYKSSKGPMAIDAMPLRYANNALAKLRRDAPERVEEIDAIAAHVAKLEAEGDDALAPIGDNGGPALEDVTPVKVDGREAIDIHAEGLLTEATNWADGVPLETQDQADKVANLVRMLQEAGNLVDDRADEEKRPINDALNEIGTWRNGWLAKGLKKTPDGKITTALITLGRLSTGWLVKQDNERKAREAKVAAAAATAAAAALAAKQHAETTTDLAVVDDAQSKMTEAMNLIKQAQGIGKAKVQVGGGEGYRAQSLRSFWSAIPTDEKDAWSAALKHYLPNEQFAAELRELIQRWANRDAQTEAGRAHPIPGFNFHEDRRAA